METLVFLFKWVVGPIIAAVVTLLVSEPLKNYLAPIIVKLGSKRQSGISGKWKTTFFYGPNEDEYCEVLEVYSLLGQYVGRIVSDDRNHAGLKSVEDQKPIRVRGAVKDNRFFTGTWFHPSNISHHYGAYKLLIDTGNDKMSGTWLGYSETKNLVENGKWVWERLR